MWDDTITIFNRYNTAAGDIYYYPTTITGVALYIDKAAAQTTTGLSDADSAKANFPVSISSDGSMSVLGAYDKPWLQPKQWAALLNDELAEYVTADEGNDIMMRGAWDKGVVDSSEYSRGGFLDYLRGKYDDVFLINSVGIYKLIPHIEISGK